MMGFPGGSDDKESACSAGDLGLIPGLGRSHGRGYGNPLQYSCLENPMDRGACGGLQSTGSQRVRHDWATMHRAAESVRVNCVVGGESELWPCPLPAYWVWVILYSVSRSVRNEDGPVWGFMRQFVAVSTKPRIIVIVALHPKQLLRLLWHCALR